jgi:hypothetical protein
MEEHVDVYVRDPRVESCGCAAAFAESRANDGKGRFYHVCGFEKGADMYDTIGPYYGELHKSKYVLARPYAASNRTVVPTMFPGTRQELENRAATQLLANAAQAVDYCGEDDLTASDRIGVKDAMLVSMLGANPRGSRIYKRHMKHIRQAKLVAEGVKFNHPVRLQKDPADDAALRHKIRNEIESASDTYLAGVDMRQKYAIAKLALHIYHMPDEDDEHWRYDTVGVAY